MQRVPCNFATENKIRPVQHDRNLLKIYTIQVVRKKPVAYYTERLSEATEKRYSLRSKSRKELWKYHHIWKLYLLFLDRTLTPRLHPSMNGLNYLWEQCTDTLIDEFLEKMYSLLIF